MRARGGAASPRHGRCPRRSRGSTRAVPADYRNRHPGSGDASVVRAPSGPVDGGGRHHVARTIRRDQIDAATRGKGTDMTVRIPTYPDLTGKVAVVTGSSLGIGAATCRMLAVNGVKVVVNGRDEAAVRKTVQDLRADGGEATGVT